MYLWLSHRQCGWQFAISWEGNGPVLQKKEFNLDTVDDFLMSQDIKFENEWDRLRQNVFLMQRPLKERWLICSPGECLVLVMSWSWNQSGLGGLTGLHMWQGPTVPMTECCLLLGLSHTLGPRLGSLWMLGAEALSVWLNELLKLALLKRWSTGVMLILINSPNEYKKDDQNSAKSSRKLTAMLYTWPFQDIKCSGHETVFVLSPRLVPSGSSWQMSLMASHLHTTGVFQDS